MRNRFWIGCAIAGLGVTLGVAWWQTPQSMVRVRTAAVPAPAEPPLRFSGLLNPAVTDPIQRPIAALAVDPGTWVVAGQVIGFVDDPVGARPARSVADPGDATAEARRGAQRADALLAASRVEELQAENRLIESELQRPSVEADARDVERRFRQGLLSSVDRDRAVQRQAQALRQEARAEREVSAEDSAVSSLEESADEARTRLLRAETAGRRSSWGNTDRRVIVAPADGVLVPMDAAAGRFGVARDPAHLNARASIAAADLDSVKLGQAVTISVDDDPALRLDGKITAIANTPAETPDGSRYDVTIDVVGGNGRPRLNAGARIVVVAHSH